MTELDFLRDLVVLFGASIAVVYGFNRLRLPAVVGFLVAGALLGPYGLDVVDNVARVEVFAEVGVVLLLFTIGVLIVQDLAVVPMMVLTPVLGGRGEAGLLAVLWSVAKAALAVLLILVAARYLVPRLLIEVVRSRSRELFVITIILVCLGIAWLSSLAGLSLALGAFIPGLIISESEYSHQAMAGILPFRGSFNRLVFISIGMLLDLRVLLAHPVLVMGLVVALVGGKMVTTVGAAVVTGYSWRAAVLTGIALAQIGEFSFILAKVGRRVGLLPGESFQVFLTVSVLTLLLTPFLLQASPRLARRAEALQRLRRS